ncbi:Amino acid transporter [Modestobacter sp. DSM 44400]|uniref:APC family permease n=1 Tax=Modestobacter sp. DSM 44400 TaxID=1550230 RepID=UPI0008988A9C|nr:APC family permease [Modestobacter sp. DSM 44400]SDX83255.1 Amino acid transporter [Modestobacter sp. DSM 44400]
MTRHADDVPVARSDSGLAHESMTQVEVLAQSVAGIAPSAVMATGPALIVLYAGSGAWLSYLAAMVVVVLIGLCVAQFARRFASSGSLYSYVARGLGPGGALAAGWGLVIGYSCIAMVGIAGTGIYLGNFLETIGLPGTSTAAVLVIFVVAALAAGAFAVAGIKLSTRLGLVLEIVSVSAVLLVLVVVLARNGFSVDTSQFRLDGVTFDGVTFGIVLAVLGFVGFESAASLGAEARNPHRAIPRAVLGSAVLAGLLYIFASYSTVLGFGGADGLAASGAPISDLATANGLGGVTWLIDLGVTASFFAVVIASINAAARVLYTMGEERVLPPALGRAHPRHKTPHVAIWLITPVVAAVPVIMFATGTSAFNIYAYTGTLGTFGYMLAYLLMAVALPAFLRRRDELKGASVVLAVIVVLALLYVFYKNVIPVPPSPYNLLPWIFLGALLLGLAWYLSVRVRTPEVTEEVGSIEEEPVPPHGLHSGGHGTAPGGADGGRDRSSEAGPPVGQA